MIVADITLFRDECREGYLPSRCMHCGLPAEGTVSRTFSWVSPLWFLLVCIGVGIIGLVVILFLLAKKMTVNIPVCQKHRNHWFVISMWLMVCAIVDIVIFLVFLSQYQEIEQNFGMSIIVVSFIMFALTIPLLYLIYTLQIRAVYINDYQIILAGVNSDFANEVEEKQQLRDENSNRGRISN